MNDEPDWAKVLEALHSDDIIWPAEQNIDSDHPVVSKVDLTPEEVHDALAYLSQAGLVGRIKVGVNADISRPGLEGVVGVTSAARSRGTYTGLTERGFLVAHQRHMEKRQQDVEKSRADRQDVINYLIGFLTFGLLTVAVLDSAAQIFMDSDQYLYAYLAVGGGLFIVGLFAFAILYVRPFSLEEYDEIQS